MGDKEKGKYGEINLSQFDTILTKEANEANFLEDKDPFPLKRIRKLSQAPSMSAEVPIMLGKACELFVLDLSVRAWERTALANRRIMQPHDFFSTVCEVENLSFLLDLATDLSKRLPPEISEDNWTISTDDLISLNDDLLSTNYRE